VLACRVEGKSPKTVDFYEGILRRFTWYLAQSIVDHVEPMTVRSFLGYVQTSEHRWGSQNPQANKKASQTTVQRYYTGLKVFFNWCVAEDYIETSPMATVKKPRAPKKLVEAISPQDIATVSYFPSGYGVLPDGLLRFGSYPHHPLL